MRIRHPFLRPAGVGQGATEYVIRRTAREIADKIADQVILMAQRKVPPEKAAGGIMQTIAEATEPSIKRVVREEVMPKVIMYGLIGILATGILASTIGAMTASHVAGRR